MHKVYYQPEGIWVGDIMPYGEDGTFYLYHQRDTRNPEPFGEPFGWALATTKDFINYKDFGESLERGSDEEVDQYIYAGTVFKVGDKYHALYTGCNRDKVRARLMKQVLLHATSDDAVKWEKNIAETLLPPQEGYDDRNWRDPFVLWDEENEEYMLILGTRVGEDKRLMTGRLVKFTSKDLNTWEFQGDWWNPGLYTMFEMPDLFKMGDWWYLVFSEYSDGNKTRYRMSQAPSTVLGLPPLTTPSTAARTTPLAPHSMASAAFSLVGSRRVTRAATPALTCGAVPSCPSRSSSARTVRSAPSFPRACSAPLARARLSKPSSSPASRARSSRCSPRMPAPPTMLDADIELGGNAAGFSVKFAEDAETGLAYEFRANLREGKLEFTPAPQYPWFQVNNMGLERPLFFKGEGTHHVRLVVDDDIATIFVDDVALNARFCNKQGQGVALTVTDGALNCANATIASL